ncbi:hypothetical protein UM764_05955 [Staphylococcus aureus]|nr:hypothetical protein UM764_05955 [Staphylococcus aureus]WRN73098.1 hypothetical protein UM582_01465 [Staphylococcus aureus]
MLGKALGGGVFPISVVLADKKYRCLYTWLTWFNIWW